MAEVQPKKIAIIINGDAAPEWQGNVLMASRQLESEGYETFVASPKNPFHGHSDHYVKPTMKNLKRLLNGIRGRLTEKDEVLIYLTGHGTVSKKSEPRLCLGQSCDNRELNDLIDFKTYGRRIVIGAQCLSGNWSPLFLDDPRTLFMSAGSVDEVVLNEFSYWLWKPPTPVPDKNGDGKLSWQERFSHAANHVTGSLPRFVPSRGFVDDGEPILPRDIMYTQGTSDVIEALSVLTPGEYAILLFTDESVKGSQSEAKFRNLARSEKGSYLWLVSKTPEAAQSFRIKDTPTIAIVDHLGTTYFVPDHSRVLEELAKFPLLPAPRMDILLRRLEKEDAEDQKMTLEKIKNLAPFFLREEIGSGLTAVRQFLVKHTKLKSQAFQTYMALAPRADAKTAQTEAGELRKLFAASDVGELAMEAYGVYAKKVDRKEAIEGAEALVKNLDWTKESAAHIAKTLTTLFTRKGLFDQKAVFRIYQKIMSATLSTIHQTPAALDMLVTILSRMEPAVVDKVLQSFTKTYLESYKPRPKYKTPSYIFRIYKKIGLHLTKDQVTAEAQRLRQDPKAQILMQLYGSIAPYAHKEEIQKGIAWILNNNDGQEYSAWTLGALAKHLKKADVSKAKETLKAILENGHDKHAVIAAVLSYAKVVITLDKNKADANALFSSFKEYLAKKKVSFPEPGTEVVQAFTEILPSLSPEHIRWGIQELCLTASFFSRFGVLRVTASKHIPLGSLDELTGFLKKAVSRFGKNEKASTAVHLRSLFPVRVKGPAPTKEDLERIKIHEGFGIGHYGPRSEEVRNRDAIIFAKMYAELAPHFTTNELKNCLKALAEIAGWTKEEAAETEWLNQMEFQRRWKNMPADFRDAYWKIFSEIHRRTKSKRK